MSKTPTLKTVTTRQTTVEGQIEFSALVALVSKQLPTRAGPLEVKIYVDVPGGGDWSYEKLECERHPVKFSATWTEVEES